MRYAKDKSVFKYKYLTLLSTALFLGIACAFHAHATDANNKSETLPLFILHFDVNRTLIAIDIAGKKETLDKSIMAILSDKYKGKWDAGINKPITFTQYARLKNPKSRLAEVEMQGNFFNFLEEESKTNIFMKSILELARQDYEKLKANFPTDKMPVFQSFFNLKRYLDKRGYNYVVLLRTFGQDGKMVKKLLENKLGMTFTEGNMEGTALKIGDKTLNPTDFHAHIKETKTHMVIQEDYKHWNDLHGRTGQGGKIFPVNEDVDACNIFFDDNIEPQHKYDQKNIVNVINISTGKPINISDLKGCNRAFKVDTGRAILEEDYFIKLVRQVYSAF